MNNILQLILGLLPVAEQVAVTFIHNADSTHKFQVIAGTVNEVAPIVAGVAAQLTAPKPTPISINPAA